MIRWNKSTYYDMQYNLYTNICTITRSIAAIDKQLQKAKQIGNVDKIRDDKKYRKVTKR